MRVGASVEGHLKIPGFFSLRRLSHADSWSSGSNWQYICSPHKWNGKISILACWGQTVSRYSCLGRDLEVDYIWNLKSDRSVFLHIICFPIGSLIYSSSLYCCWTSHCFRVVDTEPDKVLPLFGPLHLVADTEQYQWSDLRKPVLAGSLLDGQHLLWKEEDAAGLRSWPCGRGWNPPWRWVCALGGSLAPTSQSFPTCVVLSLFLLQRNS